jgi:hypothetical protein
VVLAEFAFSVTIGVTFMRLVEQQRALRNRIRAIVPYYDRVELKFDSGDKIFNHSEWAQLQEHCNQAQWYVIPKRVMG